MGRASSACVDLSIRGRRSVRRGCARWWGVMAGWVGGLDGAGWVDDEEEEGEVKEGIITGMGRKKRRAM